MFFFSFSSFSKVTGEADRASSGVVSELSEEKPSLEQPQTQTVPKETISVTPTAQEEEDDEEDQESELGIPALQ